MTVHVPTITVASRPLGNLSSALHRHTTLYVGIARLRRVTKMNEATALSEVRTSRRPPTPMRLLHCLPRRPRKVLSVVFVCGHRFQRDHGCPVYAGVRILCLAVDLDGAVCARRLKQATLSTTVQLAGHHRTGGPHTRWTVPNWYSHPSSFSPRSRRLSGTPRRLRRSAFSVRKTLRPRYRSS